MLSDADLVRHVYTYERDTGRFLWRNPPERMKRSLGGAGDEAGTIDRRRGNRMLRLGGKLHQASRLAWLYETGAWPEGQVLYRNPTLPVPARDRFENLKMSGIEELTAERARQLLDYDPETGIFVWKIGRKGVSVGAQAGNVKNVRAGAAVAYIRIDAVDYPAPRLAWLYVHGQWPPSRLRIKNGDGRDSRIDNLEVSDFEHGTRQTPTISEEERRERQAATYRRADLKRRFNLTQQEFLEMRAAQNGCCAICLQPEIATREGKLRELCVDHDHADGHVRQLLCAACNSTLGLMQEDPARLRAAALYLERHAAPDEGQEQDEAAA